MSAPIDNITCPFCNTEGWPSARWGAIYAYAAHCGTAWGNDGYSSQSEGCRIMAARILDYELTNLLKETA
jgi:hypothetical protein